VTALVVYCHPDEASFVAHLRDRAVAGLEAAGHEVDLVDLYADGFTPELSGDEWRRMLGRGPGNLAAAERYGPRLRAAEVVVFVYPTWWGGLPAMLTGWLDRVLVMGVAFTRRPDSARIRGDLKALRRLVVVTTHGSSKLFNALEGEPGKRQIGRWLRSMAHPLARTKWVALYGLDQASEQQRRAFAARVEADLALLRPRRSSARH
jgi:putative NADPH-quinone reductase